MRVVVVGGGPAGLVAAGRAAERGLKVLLIEKTARLGNKLRLTGHGRGNISHVGEVEELVAHFGSGGAFMRQALSVFGPETLCAFFAERGMPTIVEPDGRIFPATRNAHTIVSTLKRYCLAHGVTFRYHSQVSAIHVEEGRVVGVVVGSKTITAGAVILATGGMSYPATGSTGDGYALAQALGHTVTPLWPGLVGLVASDAWLPSVAGVSLKDVGLRAVQKGQVLKTVRGDVLFTHDGLSGPAALNLSLYISPAFARGTVLVQIDLAPDTSAEEMEDWVRSEMQIHGRTKVGNLLHRWLPHSMVPIGARLVGIPVERHLAEISASERRRIVRLIKGLELHLVATRPMAEAMVTIGGVSLDEVDPQTMASRLVKGLYFAGEILDIAGETGGYNLQAAFASGWMAGSSVQT